MAHSLTKSLGEFHKRWACVIKLLLPARYGKTVIRSCAKLDYDTAQQMIDSKELDSPGWFSFAHLCKS